MKKVLLFVLIVFFNSAFVLAQVIDFCTAITKEGHCENHPKKFYIPVGETANVFAVVRLLDEVGVSKVEYKIYREVSPDEDVYMTSLFQDVKPEMKTFWKKISFTQELAYKIYVYTDSGKLLTSARIFVQVDY